MPLLQQRQACLPEPALSLTIPSLHDGTPLDCRVYHPASLAAGNPRAAPWKRHAALLAHPYAPLGGSYDDGVVETLAGRLLREGYLVMTFNFRCVLAPQLWRYACPQLEGSWGKANEA